MSKQHIPTALLLSLLLSQSASRAESSGEGDVYELRAKSETYAEIFRRALLPGPNGALVTTDTAAPLQQYVSLAGYGFDSPLGRDSVDVELSVWGSVDAGEPLYLGRYDGDVQVMNVLLRGSHTALAPRLRLGRQQVAGGAARFARFDGAEASVSPLPQLTLSAYGGYTVLPRWDRQPGYYLLGSASDTLLTDPEALGDDGRAGNWLAGGRVAFDHAGVHAVASLHEQRDDGNLGRRNFGLDANAALSSQASLGGSLLFELDATRIANLRLWGDLAALRQLDLNAEYLRTEPALLLSRQSVLSVFSTDAYQEAGGGLRWRLDERFTLGGDGFVQFYDEGGPGARVSASGRFAPKNWRRTVALLGYTRVSAPDNGYHSMRAALSSRLFGALSGTLQFYGYFYDEPIEGYRSSSIYSTTLEYALLERLLLLWGGSIARSPYASLDASTLVRLSYEFQNAERRPAW
jgi:hypothetical protein